MREAPVVGARSGKLTTSGSREQALSVPASISDGSHLRNEIKARSMIR
jgi:hypothetical protein